MIVSEPLPSSLPKASERPFMLWGTGRMGESALEHLRGAISFAAAINNLTSAAAAPWHGLPVMTSAQALAASPDRPFVIVATMYLDQIEAELEQRGYRRAIDWCHVDDVVSGVCVPGLLDQRARWQARLALPRRVSLHDLAAVDDDFWLWLNLQAPSDAVTGGLVAPWPPAAMQERLTGTSGRVSITHGFNQYRLMKGLAERAGVRLAEARQIIDFGCGYARIGRFFRKDAPGAHLIGVDVDTTLLDWCRSNLGFGEWQRVPSLPPTGMARHAASLLVSFSVFSHLSEESQAAWLEEIHGWLEPGGVAVVTLWTHPSKSQDYHLRHFPDYADLTADFEAGRFCYSNRCYGSGSTYGEAFVPHSYVERTWTRWFDIVEWLADHPTSPSQTHVAIRKR